MNYYEFFEYFLSKILISFLEQHVQIIEFRHIFGCVIDDDANPIGVKKECEMIDRVVKTLQMQYPLLQVKIINCSLKFLGKPHCQAMIDATLEAQNYTDMVVGFDMVCEEDVNLGIAEFAPMILEAR
jgi:adenosine deaminase CECR1